MEKNEKIDERIIFKEYGKKIKKRQIYERIHLMKLEDILCSEVRLNFKRRRKKKKRKEKKRKEICSVQTSSDLRNKKKCNISFALQSLPSL